MRDCLLLRQEWTDDNCSTEETCLEQFYKANPILRLLPGGCTQKREEGRLFGQYEGPVLESHDRDRQAVVRESVYPKPSQWATLVSTLGQAWADPPPPPKGAQARQALHTQVCSAAPFPAHGRSCRRMFKSNANYRPLKKAKACFSILSSWSQRCLVKYGIAVLAVHFMKAPLQKMQK